MADRVLNLYKEIGETPLERIDRLRSRVPRHKESKLSYAGRLDPLAEGVLIVLIGDENKNQDIYFNLSKEYEVEVLLGVKTDTYDLLGLATENKNEANLDKLKESIKKFLGSFLQKYPPFSSKPLNGKPLFYWARKGELKESDIPKKEVEIKNIEIISIRKINLSDLRSIVFERIEKVKGDFRQDEIISRWEKLIDKSKRKKFSVIKLRVSSGSGAYMRSIANDLGESLGTSALALSIKRVRVGNFRIEDSLR